jgi:hypothetical protein
MFKDLPEEIPLQLSIGTKVTARLRKPQDGLFSGSIDAVDTSNNTYRITFERQGLGTHSIPDYEVLVSNSSISSQFDSYSISSVKRPRRDDFRGQHRCSVASKNVQQHSRGNDVEDQIRQQSVVVVASKVQTTQCGDRRRLPGQVAGNARAAAENSENQTVQSQLSEGHEHGSRTAHIHGHFVPARFCQTLCNFYFGA